jgi:hypothetical protein
MELMLCGIGYCSFIQILNFKMRKVIREILRFLFSNQKLGQWFFDSLLKSSIV